MCKSSNDNVQPVDLKNEPFEEISITVNDKEKIRFDEKKEKWLPSIAAFKTRSNNTHMNSGEGSEFTQRIANLNDDIQKKKDKIEELKSKIREIDDKLDTMKKILNIDVSEQEYVKELAKKINEENANV